MMIEDLYRLAFDAVRQHLLAAGVALEEDDGDLLFLGHRLGMSIAFEGFERQDKQVIAPLDIQMHVDGCEGDRFRLGTLGVGADAAAALADGIQEWHLLAASPVLSALGAPPARSAGDAARYMGRWQVFPGRAGIRGSRPPQLAPTAPFFRELLAALKAQVRTWKTPDKFELRSIFAMISSSEGNVEIQAAVNGFVDASLVERLTALPWPKPANAYLYKQLFVFSAGE